MLLRRSLGRLGFYLKNINKSQALYYKILTDRLVTHGISVFILSKNEIHTSCVAKDLMEFFDDKANWSEKEVKVGRSWKLEELRIKSNSDLHKLWYVLLKEKNMLLTMEHECHRQGRGLPNPERLDKVEESMENLERVVRERNKAYFELETGETGERPFGFDTNCFGLEYKYKMREHLVEKNLNAKYWAEKKLFNHTDDHKYVENFLSRLEEKKRKKAHYNKKRRHLQACELMKHFPHLDEEALKAQFPELDIEAVKQDPRSRGFSPIVPVEGNILGKQSSSIFYLELLSSYHAAKEHFN